MKELQEILKKISQFEPDEKAILATVVDVVGSGYRRPGARMLIDENGYSIGTVSGGCLEADVLQRAKKVLETGEAAVITYDTTKDENSVFGLGMGCRGIVRILLESIDKENNLFRIFQSVIEDRTSHCIATIITSSRAVTGGRIFFSIEEYFEEFGFKNLPSDLEMLEDLRNDCRSFLKDDKSPEVRHYKIGNDNFEMSFEILAPPLNLLLFGVGYDALPLIKFAKELGWHVTAIDHRAAFANAERLPEVDEVIVSSSENLPEEIFADENSVAVVMTHNYDRDREILARLLDSKCRYIGALGPKRRTENLIQELRDAGGRFDEEALKKVYAPVGLDIGAKTPEAIALSIVAEIQSVLANRAGGFLRLRKTNIYDRK